MHNFSNRFYREHGSAKISSEKGMSILEILIAVGIISLICVPVIQVIYSLRPSYILDMVKDVPSILLSKSTDIQNVSYYMDGALRAVYKRGGMKEIQNLSHPNLVEGVGIDTVFNRHTCRDFNKNFNTDKKPILYTYTLEDLGISGDAKFTGLVFIGNSLLISADSSSTTLPDLYSFTLDTPLYNSENPFGGSKPVFIPDLSEDTGPGISQLQSFGTYILTANTGVKNQANIFRIGLHMVAMVNASTTTSATVDASPISTVNSISKQLDLTIPGSNSSTTPITKISIYANGRVYVGTEKSVLPEIFIFNAKTGFVEGSIETGYGINDLLILNDMLIVAGPRDPEIEIFSLTTFQKIGTYDLSGGSGNAKILNIFGDTLYVGRTKGGDELEILTIQRSEEHPLSLFTHILEPAFSKKISWSVDKILKYEDILMLFTAKEYQEFEMFNVADNISFALNSTYKIDLPDRASDVVCFKNSIWMTYKNIDNANLSKLGALVFI